MTKSMTVGEPCTSTWPFTAVAAMPEPTGKTGMAAAAGGETTAVACRVSGHAWQDPGHSCDTTELAGRLGLKEAMSVLQEKRGDCSNCSQVRPTFATSPAGSSLQPLPDSLLPTSSSVCLLSPAEGRRLLAT
eukprot:CAMPEP_0175151106 /NCGR_PEP_ID=MMETSP0087-20121206/18291_1 /TAXON_ID=136419 /ORGANISM="Unknown Unknown, Strain D1" /LENGTH=131 /DNA_ID=CAMNT_0016437225 /DNA_START=461 /DNA_END=856 /DNA_ORIENTATION=+